jgi:uncharacterized protein (DUF2062 family)
VSWRSSSRPRVYSRINESLINLKNFSRRYEGIRAGRARNEELQGRPRETGFERQFGYSMKLPTSVVYSTMNPIAWLRTKWGQLLSLKDTSHAIAAGMAVGMFFGLIPLWGIKTLLAIGVARLLRANLIAATIAVTLHDVVLPLIPLLLRWEYDIGYWLLSHPHELPPTLHLSHQSPGTWFHWSTFLTVGRPLLVGSLIVAAPIAVMTYYLTLVLVERVQRKPDSQ